MGRKYVFRKKWKRVLMALFDSAGTILFLMVRVFRKSHSPVPNRILIIRLDSLGDAVLTLPAIQALEKRFPKAQIDFLVSSPAQNLFRFLFPRSTVHLFEKNWLAGRGTFKEIWKEFFRVANELRALRYDLGIDFRGDLRTILLMGWAKIPNRWGRGGAGGGFFLTRCHPYPYRKHEILENLDLVREEGTFPKAEFQRISLPPQSLEPVEKWLAPAKGRRKIVIHPGAGYPSKRWPAANFVDLAQRIQDKRLGFPIFIGSAEEKNLLDSCQNQLKDGFLDLTGKTTFEELLGLLERVDLFIGNDSGPAHLAACLGCRLVIVFSGTNDFRRWAPWSSTLRVVNHSVPCSPCEEKVCPLERHFCMEDISVDAVFRATEEMLRD